MGHIYILSGVAGRSGSGWAGLGIGQERKRWVAANYRSPPPLSKKGERPGRRGLLAVSELRRGGVSSGNKYIGTQRGGESGCLIQEPPPAARGRRYPGKRRVLRCLRRLGSKSGRHSGESYPVGRRFGWRRGRIVAVRMAEPTGDTASVVRRQDRFQHPIYLLRSSCLRHSSASSGYALAISTNTFRLTGWYTSRPPTIPVWSMATS